MEWIPVEERLPEECKEYLVTAISRITGEENVYIDLFIPTDNRFCVSNVIAWAEMPKPYSPE